MIGSTVKCGLPSACTSPAARVTFAGTFIKRMPCDAWTRPGLPISIFGLRAFSRSGGNQPSSSSAPPSIRTSALRTETTKLGRASTKCGSSVVFARTVTLTLSPPISRASDPKSGSVATTLSFACAEQAQATIAHKINEIFFMNLEFVSTVRAENEFPLQKDRLDFPCREEKVFLQKILVVLQADFRKLSRIPRDIRAETPT